MKVIVIEEFHDINNFAKVFAKDTEAEFDDERAQRLIDRGLAKPLNAEEVIEAKADDEVKANEEPKADELPFGGGLEEEQIQEEEKRKQNRYDG